MVREQDLLRRPGVALLRAIPNGRQARWRGLVAGGREEDDPIQAGQRVGLSALEHDWIGALERLEQSGTSATLPRGNDADDGALAGGRHRYATPLRPRTTGIVLIRIRRSSHSDRCAA